MSKITVETCGKSYCEHYPEGLFVCAKCREESTIAHDKACAKIAEARADADHWKSECDALQRMVHEVRAEIERLKLTTGELTGAFNARPKCEKCERKDQLIEQMRKALRAWTRTPNIPLYEAIKITNAALEAVEGIDNRAE